MPFTEMSKARVVGAMLLSLLGAPWACSSSSSGSDGACPTYCTGFCQSLSQCHLATGTTCVSDCESGVGANGCASLRPPSQFTCSELTGVYDCAKYCVAFCQRVPSCGAFDQNLCLQGCGDENPLVCNPASVAARTCDQLKPEARDYQDLANALNNRMGGIIATSQQTYGLCTDSSECSNGQGCVAATNTCAPCTTNAECAQQFGTYACKSGVCTTVDCLKNSDCIGASDPICDTSQYTCVECLTTPDCVGNPFGTSLGGQPRKCDANHNCVDCLSNADCASFPLPNLTCVNGACQ